jgi:hypothetical protein
MKLNSNDKTERKNEGNAKKKKEGLSWGGGNQKTNLDTLINPSMTLTNLKKLNKHSKSI